MELNSKIIFVSDENLKNELIEQFSLNEKIINSKTVFIGKNKFGDGEEIILVNFSENNIKENIAFIKENFLFEKLIFVGNSVILRDQDLEEGDIILPNTFVDENSQNPIFIDYAIGDNIDFNKFGLILNGVCISGKNPKKSENDLFLADVNNEESYIFLKNLENEDLEKSVILLKCITKNSKSLDYENLITILEMAL